MTNQQNSKPGQRLTVRTDGSAIAGAEDQTNSTAARRRVGALLVTAAVATGTVVGLSDQGNHKKAPSNANVPAHVAQPVDATMSKDMGVPVPDLTGKPGVSEANLPPALWHRTKETAGPGEGARKLVEAVDPEILTGQHSSTAVGQEAIDFVQQQGVGPNHEIMKGQTVYVPDLHPGNPSPQLPIDTQGTHVT